MILGVPRETKRDEHRVALTPYAVSRLTEHGHTVLVERNAGLDARFSNAEYEEAGANVVFSSEEAYKRADIVCRVGLLTHDELDLLKDESVICAFHHLGVAPRQTVEQLMNRRATIVAYEMIQDATGGRPILQPMSEMAGQMAVQVAAHCLETGSGGRGLLIGTVPGMPAPTVLILGAGQVGRSAARSALALGARVIVLDEDVGKLRLLHRRVSRHVETFVVGVHRLDELTAIADVLIGAVLIPGARAPYLVTEDMVKAMKGGSVIIDISIDQGGCVETSRPTTLEDPTFIVHDVVHYCVPNMTANIARTASRALADAMHPYLLSIGRNGLEAALAEDRGLAEGVYLYRGRAVNRQLAEMLGVEPLRLEQGMAGEAS
jgi:alanine dehydrogenase